MKGQLIELSIPTYFEFRWDATHGTVGIVIDKPVARVLASTLIQHLLEGVDCDSSISDTDHRELNVRRFLPKPKADSRKRTAGGGS